MGFVRSDESRRTEIEEFRRMLLSCAGVRRSKDDGGGLERRRFTGGELERFDRDLVCVTSGVSFLGIAIVNQLLLRGFPVRIIVDNQEEIERLREMEISGEMRGAKSMIGMVVAKMSDRQSLLEAFEGCCGVFHTASSVDPSGISGYSKSMAEIEVKACENVMETCATAQSVRYCVLTSSLLTCIWRGNSTNNDNSPIVIDHNSWSDESFCQDNKLWYALGKLRAEKAASRIATEQGLKLASICSGLITGPNYHCRSPSSMIAYLKGAQAMYEDGLLATVDVERLAKAHVRVFEEMKRTASGRYVCYDQVVRSTEEVQKLAQETGIGLNLTPGNGSWNPGQRLELSNRKLSSLMSVTQRCMLGHDL